MTFVARLHHQKHFFLIISFITLHVPIFITIFAPKFFKKKNAIINFNLPFIRL